LDPAILFSLQLSFQVAGVAAFFVFLTGLFIAYPLARKNFPGKEFVDVLCTLPLVLPPTVTGYYLIVFLGRKGILGSYLYELTGWSFMFTWQGAALASYVVALPLMIKITRAAFESVDQKLIQASYTLGHSELRTALSVVLPLAKKGIIAGTILSFARALGEFGATLMVAGNIPGKTSTMPLMIYSLASGGEWGRAHLLVLFFTLISGFFLFSANKLSKRGNGWV
jgi:molybdate transport system permease protein